MNNQSFTLIELLIVIGILSVLVVTILVTLNPSEAQKKTRDAKRMKDLATLEAIIVQYINDGNAPVCPTRCTSRAAGQVKSQHCNNNWIGVNLCQYSNTIPVDPINNVDANYVCRPANICGPYNFAYSMRMSGGDYKIGVLQESRTNVKNINNASGTGEWAVAVSSQEGMSLW